VLLYMLGGKRLPGRQNRCKAWWRGRERGGERKDGGGKEGEKKSEGESTCGKKVQGVGGQRRERGSSGEETFDWDKKKKKRTKGR